MEPQRGRGLSNRWNPNPPGNLQISLVQAKGDPNYYYYYYQTTLHSGKQGSALLAAKTCPWAPMSAVPIRIKFKLPIRNIYSQWKPQTSILLYFSGKIIKNYVCKNINNLKYLTIYLYNKTRHSYTCCFQPAERLDRMGRNFLDTLRWLGGVIR